MIAEVRELQQIESELSKRTAKSSLLGFTEYTFPGYETNWHHTKTAEYVDLVLSGEIKYLVIQEPPRHGKSELISRRLPAYAFGQNPDEQIISCSYSADLASRMNRDVQRIIDDDRYRELYPEIQLPARGIKQDKVKYIRNNDMFEIIDNKGSYRCAGVNGGITGMGFTLGLIDDPIKNQEEAKSETYREKTWEWFTTTFYTRMEKFGRIIVVATRWHEDDLIGRILNSRRASDWALLSLPAINETGSSNDDPRAEGEALWPGKYPIARLETIKSVMDHTFPALYQQRPTAMEGAIYKREYWEYYDILPNERLMQKIHSWDTAFKKGKENDKTALIVGYLFPSGVYITKIFSGKMEFPELDKKVRQEFNADSCHACLIEDKASGQSLIQVLIAETRIPVIPVQVCTDKESRAQAVTPQIKSKRVFLPNNEPWVSDFVDELASFPNAKYKDLADALSQLLDYVIQQKSGCFNPNSVASSKPKLEKRGW